MVFHAGDSEHDGRRAHDSYGQEPHHDNDNHSLENTEPLPEGQDNAVESGGKV